MLKGISSLISPALLKILMEMGHGDEVVLADGNFPAASHASRVVRCDGLGIPELLEAVLRLFPLDTYVENPVGLMAVVAGDTTETPIWDTYRQIAERSEGRPVSFEQIERFAFFMKGQKRAYAIVATGESALYANIVLKKRGNRHIREVEWDVRIDAHQHYWKLERNDYGWITPADKVLYRDYLPDDLAGLLERNGISRSIVVQAAQTHAETDFLLELADRHDSIAGVVGWLDLHNPDYLRILQGFLGHEKFAGVRIMIQEMQNPDEVLQPDTLEVIRYMESINLPVDLLCRSSQLHAVVELLGKVPNLRGVIDHIAKPLIAERQFKPGKCRWPSLLPILASTASCREWLRRRITPIGSRRILILISFMRWSFLDRRGSCLAAIGLFVCWQQATMR